MRTSHRVNYPALMVKGDVYSNKSLEYITVNNTIEALDSHMEGYRFTAVNAHFVNYIIIKNSTK